MDKVRYRREGRLAWLTLDRPEKLNAIDADMIAGLHEALDRAEGDAEVRVVVLNGNGRSFSAGFDLNTGSDASDPDAVRRELEADLAVIMRFWNSPLPTVAAVHGHCLGSGMEMALACDVTLAAEGCLFGAPEVRFGSGIVALILPWLIGPKRAKELLLTGDDQVDARQAEAWGMVNRVVAAEELEAEARELALEIAGNDAVAVRLTKRAINRSLSLAGFDEALREALELDLEIETSDTPESRRFNEILNAEGARAAVAWRRAQS